MSIEIIYAQEKYIDGFYAALGSVASERIYLEMTEAPVKEKTAAFQSKLIASNAPVYYALVGGQVVGWCDVCLSENPRQKHRGSMGMGIINGFRGIGIGTKLLSAVLDHAKQIGLEKIELHVYTANTPAIALYKKFGFVEEGLIKKYRKLDGEYFDALMMARFL